MKLNPEDLQPADSQIPDVGPLDLTGATPIVDPVDIYQSVRDADPAIVAETQKLAKELDSSPVAVSENINDARHAVKQPDWDKMRKEAPALYNMAVDPSFAAKAKNDFHRLQALESAYRKPDLTVGRLFDKAKASFKQQFADITIGSYREVANMDIESERGIEAAIKWSKLGSRNRAKFNSYVDEYLKDGMTKQQAEAEAAIRNVVEQRHSLWRQSMAPDNQIPEHLKSSSGLTEDVVGAMSGSSFGMLSTAAFGAPGGAVFFSQMYGAKYRELRSAGIDDQVAHEAALISAAGQAPLETAGSLLQLKAVSKVMGVFAEKTGLKLAANTVVTKIGKEQLTKALGQFAGAVGISMAGEGMEEYLQNFPDLLADVYAENPDMTWQETTAEFLSRIPDTALSSDAAHSALVGALSGGGFTTAIGGPSLTIGYYSQKKKAENFSKKLKEMQESITDLENLDKEAYVEYLNNMASEAGTGEFYVDPDVLLQSLSDNGQDVENWAGRHGMTREDILKAAEEGQLVGIEAGRVIGALKEDEVMQSLINDMTVRRDDVSFNQLDVAGEQDLAAEVRLRELYEEKARAEATPEQIAVLEEQIYESAKNAGIKGYTKENVRAQSVVILAGVNKWVHEMNKLEGVDVSFDDFFKEFNLSVGQQGQNQPPGDTIIDQAEAAALAEVDPFDDTPALMEFAIADAADIENNIISSGKVASDGNVLNATVSANTVVGSWYMGEGFNSREVVKALRKFSAGEKLGSRQEQIIGLYRQHIQDLKESMRSPIDEMSPFQSANVLYQGEPAINLNHTDELMALIPEKIIQLSDEALAKEETINTLSAEELKERLDNAVEELYGEGARTQGRRVDLILGLPASGKSTIANPIIAAHGSLLIDSDAAKELLPEFDNGRGATVVHEESSEISTAVLEKAIENGDNIVIPIIGAKESSVRKRTDLLEAAGYEVNIHYVDLPIEESISRNVTRYYEDGRLVDPRRTIEVEGKPLEVFLSLEENGGFNGYQAYDNFVPRGEQAIPLETEELRKSGVVRSGRGQVSRQTGEEARSQAESREEIKQRSLINEESTESEGVAGLPIDSTIQTFDPVGGDVLYQSAGEKLSLSISAVSPLGFYSQLSEELGRSIFDQKTLTGEQLSKKIDKAIASGKIKAEEVDAVGLKDYLELNKDVSLTPDQVKAFVEQNGVQVEEVVNAGTTKYREEDLEYLGIESNIAETVSFHLINVPGNQLQIPVSTYPTKADAMAYALTKDKNGDTTKYAEYQLPGEKTDYREVLLTLPQNNQSPERVAWEDFQSRMMQKYGELNVDNFSPNEEAERVRLAKAAAMSPDNAFTSSHFDEKNILTHIRMNTRTVNGEKVLFIEEIQSDWNIEGRKKGFAGSLGEISIKQLEDGRWEVSRGGDKTVLPRSRFVTEADARAWAEAEYKGQGIPTAPFVTSSSWQNLVTKRILRIAAEEGFARVAWINGEQTAARYSLDKHVEQIEVQSMPDQTRLIVSEVNGGLINIWMTKDGNITDSTQDSLKGKSIDDVLGKEIGKRIVESDKDETLKGDDLKIEAKWARNLYDKALPNLMNKLGKKSGAKTEVINIETASESEIMWSIEADGVNVIEQDGDRREFATEGEAQEYVNTLKGATQQLSLPITPELRKEVMETGLPLFQTNADQRSSGTRGEIQFQNDRASANIELSPNADLSTFLHETGHFFLEMVRITATKHGAFADEWETIKEFIGAEDGKQITREQHEKWADSWETYMMEGNAPSLKLQGAFDRFTRWLKSIYKSIAPGQLTDEVRGVMDRLLATEEEIEEAKAAKGLFSIIDAAARESIGIDTPGMQKYLKALGLTDDETARAIDLHKMRNLKARRKEYTEQATDEWRETPSRAAIVYAKANGGISTTEIESYGVEDMPNDVGLFRVDGLPMQEVADEIGVTKDELVEVLRNHKSRDEFVTDRVAELEEAHDLEMPADEAIHNAAMREQMAQESALLAKLSQRERVLQNRQIAKYAKSEVSKMTKKQVRDTNKTISALRRLRVEANRLVKSGKYSEALDANEKARINEAILAEQIRTKERIDKIEKRWSRIFKSLKKNPGNYDMAFRDQLHQLANRFQLFKNQLPVEEQKHLLDFFAQMNEKAPADYTQSLDLIAGTYGTYDWLYDDQETGRFQDLPFQKMSELDDLIVFLQKNGRVDKGEFLLDGETRIADVVEELIEAVAGVRKGKLSSLSVTTNLRKLIRRYGAEHIPLQYILSRMDGYKTDFTGANIRLLFNPLSEAAAREHELQREIHDKLKPVLDQLRESAEKHARLLRHVDAPESFNNPESSDVKDHWTFDKVLAVALNMGNQDNLQKLMDGYGWEYQDVLDVIAILTEQDLKNVQNIHDIIGSLWPDIAAMHKKIHGYTPKKVESAEYTIPAVQEHTTESGVQIPARAAVTMKGGYYPLKYDHGKSRRQTAQDDRQSILESQNAIYPSTKTPQGFAINRQATAGGKPVLLSLNVLTDHISHVTHHVTHADVVTDIDRITNSRGYANAVTEAFGTDLERQIRPALARVANPRSNGQTTVVDNVLEGERSRAAAYILWYNIRVAVKQPFSLFNLWQAMGTMDGGAAILKEYASIMTGGEGSLFKYIEQIHKLSPNMARRAKAIDRELQRPENFGAVRKLNARESVRKNLDKLSDTTGPVLIRMMDMVAAYPGWMAAYKVGLKKFDNDMGEAVNYADNVISATQPFDRPLDQSMIRGSKKGLHRMFTMFTGYTMKYANRRSFYWQGFTEHIKSGGKTGIGPMEFMSHVLLERMLPSMLMTMMLSYGFKDEPPEMEDILIDMLLFQFAGRAVVQDVAAALFTATRYGSDSVFRTPLETGAKTVIKATKRLYDSYENGEIPEALFAFLSETLGYWYKLPIIRRKS